MPVLKSIKFLLSFYLVFLKNKDRETNDIDIGVKGIEPRLFFKFYEELYKYLPKPVDLVDLSKSQFLMTLWKKLV